MSSLDELNKLLPEEDREGGITDEVSNKYLTQSLFYETGKGDDRALFTTKRKHHKGYVSLYKLYMEIADPTEYLFAKAAFGSWEQWKRVKNNKLLSKLMKIHEWEEELEIRIRSLGIKATILAASEGKTDAAKYIAEKKWDKRRAGRPTNEEVLRETVIARKLDKETEDELQRLGIH